MVVGFVVWSPHYFKLWASTRLSCVHTVNCIPFSRISKSFILACLLDVLLLFLALDLAVFLLVLGLLLSCNCLIALVFSFKALFGGRIDSLPHITDDLGDLCDLGGRVVGLDTVVNFLPIEEKG